MLRMYIYFLASFGLFLIGLYAVLSKKNLIKVIIGLDLMETGVNLFLISLGYVKGGSAPIFEKAMGAFKMVDPIPQALVLTSIVIGVSVTALALSLSVKLHEKSGTLDLTKLRSLKW
jgi:multicomponent Na+:H+ antiporter subunit C